ncbi:hypothetical protein AAGR22_06690 [Erwinia sp. HDF1-3R]|uniref:hypothetical protein n=1 Tax=Erwinia sp. HDF1-3R TaxID=3141543 RepID=UPI0031F4E1E1
MPFKLKAIVWVIGGILGIYIPTSMLSLNIHNGFYVKQMANCGEDASNSLASLLSGDEMSIRGNDLDNIAKDLKSCQKNLDYNKGLVTSLREERARDSKQTSSLK